MAVLSKHVDARGGNTNTVFKGTTFLWDAYVHWITFFSQLLCCLKIPGLSNQPNQNGFLGVHAVVRLEEHDRMRPIRDFIGDFVSPMGW
jgi:hypothetical protein